MEPYSKLAEHNGTFIETTLKAMFQINGDIPRIDVNHIGDVKSDLEDKKGLYVFFVRIGLLYYPIYVGYTGNNFYDRLRQHGVRNRVGDLQVNDDNLQIDQLCVSVFPCDAGAKTLESLFLKAFNFALNSEENEGVRGSLDLSQRNQFAKSKVILQQAWEETKQGVLAMMQMIERMEAIIQILK